MNQTRSIRKAGFTLVEVMFAVIVFGIGLIMVAGIFPVAIQQSRLNTEETSAAATALIGTNTLERCANDTFLPSTGPSNGGLVKFDYTLFNTWAAGNCILPGDPRMAWVSVYNRPAGARYAQTFVFSLQARDVSTYVLSSSVAGAVTLPQQFPRLVTITTVAATATTPPTIEFATPAILPVGSPPSTKDAAVTRCFVVIADDKNLPAVYNGNILRVGNPISGDTYEVAPGYETPTITLGKAYIVGKTFDGSAYSGAPQDVAVYSSFVPIK